MSTKDKNKLRSIEDRYSEQRAEINNKIQATNNNRDFLKNTLQDVEKKLSKLKGYAKGSKHINEDGIVLTQEKGAELQFDSKSGAIVTPDGAHLTHVHGGDMIFTNEMSENLWKLAKMNPAQLGITSQFTKLPDMSRNVSNSGNTTIQIGDIKMEGVNDVETFGRQLREEILRNGKTIQCITEAVSAKQLRKKDVGNARLYK